MEQRWEAKVSTSVANASADQIWSLFKDFFNLHKWFSSVTTCRGVHGTNGEPGCVRYCAGSSIPPNGSDGSRVSWSTERLTAIDSVDRSLSYEIVDCNIGFKSYLSTVKVIPGSDGGCVIEWMFTIDPVEGWRLEDLVKKYEIGLQSMAKKMEDSLQNSNFETSCLTKWEGKAAVRLRGATPDQVWAQLEDFCSLDKWLSSIETCQQVEGVYGQPGLVRYCASAASGGDEAMTRWCRERLVAIDPIKRYLSYEVLENNVGFKSYEATITASPSIGDDQPGCQIEWSYVSDRLDGWTKEALDSYIHSSLHEMADKMEKAIQQAHQ